jgi:hypothetical protein
MAVFFPRIYQVIRRNPGAYVNGVWTPATDTASVDMPMNIQPASSSDYERVQAVASGRRVTAMMRAFAPIDADLKVAGTNDYPGDIVIYGDRRWLVIGSSRWDVLADPELDHIRYMLALEAEHAPGEVTA